MNELFENHHPSEDAVRRARAAGIDLDAARSEDPASYMMICSVPVLRVAGELRGVAEGPLLSALADQRLFEAPTGAGAVVLAFPGPSSEQLERLDDLMGAAVEEEARRRYGFYRVVRDRSGSRRELGLPVAPDDWDGSEAMVGPFEDEASAWEWARGRSDPRSGTTHDVLKYAGGWFCDLFRAGEG
jgi:hypothetical protein